MFRKTYGRAIKPSVCAASAGDVSKRGLTSQLQRTFTTSITYRADFTHVVVGGGVVGLAIARHLARYNSSSTLLIEKHRSAGNETSSRNSEVIHAGLYYGHGSLKTKLCLRGKQMMYELCKEKKIPHRKCGKWIVAQDDEQLDALNSVHAFARSLDPTLVPTRFLSVREVESLEPDVRAQAGVLESSSTGIVDSHSLMEFLQGDLQSCGGEMVFGSEVIRIEPLQRGEAGWKIWTRDAIGGEEDEPITTENLINSAGLGAVAISNLALPAERNRKPYYAKGSYWSYSSKAPKPTRLIYPAPIPGHGGLGTHLTVDMAGNIRFGPDLQWVDSSEDISPNNDTTSLEIALRDIKSYLPGLEVEAVKPDYSGIRPKLTPVASATSGKGFEDFYITEEPGFRGFVNLLGIESPGLTSSLAIAEHVSRLLYA